MGTGGKERRQRPLTILVESKISQAHVFRYKMSLKKSNFTFEKQVRKMHLAPKDFIVTDHTQLI